MLNLAEADEMPLEPRVVEIRASAFGGAFDCSLRFQKEQLEGMRMPNSPRALIGSGLHAGSAAFDQAKVNGSPISAADAADSVIDCINQRIADEGVAWRSDEPNRREVEVTALKLTTTYCTEISPRYEFDAVELTTKPLDVDCGGGVVVRLKGTLDRCRVRRSATGKGRGISDVKSGKTAVTAGKANTSRHRAQLGTYELLYEHTTGNAIELPAEIIGMNTTGKMETGTGLTNRPRDLLLGSDDAPGLIELAAMMFRTGLFPPNPQSPLCSAKYCAFHSRCPYADK